MKILITVPNMEIGGVQSFVAYLANRLANSDDEIILSIFADEISPKYRGMLNCDHLKIECLHKKPGFSLRFLLRLNSFIKRINPDVINTHSSRSLRYVFLLPRCKKVPIVHTITSNPKIYDRRLYWLYKRRAHQKSWGNISFVGISDTITKTFINIYGVSPARVATIYNGIPLPNSKTKTLVEKGEAILFNCASLTPIKNQRILIDAMKRIDAKVRLFIAGDGPCKETLKEQASQNGVTNRIVFLGNVTDPAAYFDKASFFVLSSFSEGNPITILEAFAHGLPVIAPRVGGIPDLVRDGENGWLFDKTSSPDDLLEALKKALQVSNREYTSISRRNAEVVKQWDIDLISKQYRELFALKTEEL